MDNNKCVCPVCLGTGLFEHPSHIKDDDVKIKEHLAIYLSDKGYSIRQIMRVLNYKSPRSISLLINKKK